jgi:hypothetical protein
MRKIILYVLINIFAVDLMVFALTPAESQELQQINEELELLVDQTKNYQTRARQIEAEAQTEFLTDWKDFGKSIQDSEKMENKADQLEKRIEQLRKRQEVLKEKMTSS